VPPMGAPEELGSRGPLPWIPVSILGECQNRIV
jgi:hypothetical protein